MSTSLDQAEYISLRSYKRDGGAVDTPVWCAPLDDKLVIFTLRETYKVKRVQRNPKVQVARCDVRGGLLGPWQEGTCRAVDEPNVKRPRVCVADGEVRLEDADR